MGSNVQSDLVGTRKPAFAIQDAALTRGAEGLNLDADKWLGDGLGSQGPIGVFLVPTPSAMALDFLADGARLKTTLSNPGPYTVASITGPAEGGLFWLVIDNSTGAPQTITWPGNVTWGTNGPPVIPDSETCTILFAWDSNATLVHGQHNCPAAALPGMRYTDTGILVTGGVIGGSSIVAGAIGSEARGMSVGVYDYSTAEPWQLWVHPVPTVGAFELGIYRRAFGNVAPSAGDSIVASAPPLLTANSVDFTETGATSTWTGTLAFGDMLTVVPTVNTAGVTWWALLIPARRTF